MGLSQVKAERLYSRFVSRTEQAEDFRFKKEGYRFGGQWFCPGCGVQMNEENAGAVKCGLWAEHRKVPASTDGTASTHR